MEDDKITKLERNVGCIQAIITFWIIVKLILWIIL